MNGCTSVDHCERVCWECVADRFMQHVNDVCADLPQCYCLCVSKNGRDITLELILSLHIYLCLSVQHLLRFRGNISND